jgi:hypothetical protein
MGLPLSCSTHGIVTVLRAGQSRNRVSILNIGKSFFIFSEVFRIAMRPTQPSLHWIKGEFPGLSGQGIKLTADILMLSIKVSGPMLPLTHIPSWRA